MSSNIKIKRSETAGNPSILGAGELAYSALADTGSNGGDRLYIGMGTETAGNAVNHVVIGGKYFTDTINNATSSNTVSTLVRRDGNSNFSANNITAVSFIGSLSGNVSGNAASATKWASARNISLTGDASATIVNLDGTSAVSAELTLATVNAQVGVYGSATSIPIITVNNKGLITSVTTAAVASALNISGNTGTDTISLLADTLSLVGGVGVSSTVTNNQVSFAIGQAVNTNSSVIFNNVDITGTLSSNDITSTNISIAGNATITGNLTVQGTTTTINSTIVEVSDLNLTVAKDATTAAAANGAGITVNGAAATLTYSSADDRWNFNKSLNVDTIYGVLSGNASTTTKWATARNLSLTGDATAILSAVDGSSAVSAALTLATVNSNVGNFGSSTTIPNITVNAKGLITAISATAIPTATSILNGLASFSTSNFLVTAGAVTIVTVDGGTY